MNQEFFEADKSRQQGKGLTRTCLRNTRTKIPITNCQMPKSETITISEFCNMSHRLILYIALRALKQSLTPMIVSASPAM